MLKLQKRSRGHSIESLQMYRKKNLLIIAVKSEKNNESTSLRLMMFVYSSTGMVDIKSDCLPELMSLAFFTGPTVAIYVGRLAVYSVRDNLSE